MVASVTAAGPSPAATRSGAPASGPTLGQSDFIRLLTTQMKQQDPTDPVDNKEMIAQMAQFSSLSGIEQINSTLKAIAARLDQVIAAQSPVQE
ncbi:MAG: flagellar biosynthesis protein FlgD [Sphingomonadaceae bacterium]|nr:flagellar biosynthesis protein FlgD [Sphingomonadaceae bacterium]